MKREEEKFVAIPSRTDTFVAETYFVVTPKGDVVDLPAQATPIDFAFSIHFGTRIFLRMAKVNGKIVPLDYILQSGDVVEVVTNRSATRVRVGFRCVFTSKGEKPFAKFLSCARSRNTASRRSKSAQSSTGSAWTPRTRSIFFCTSAFSRETTFPKKKTRGNPYAYWFGNAFGRNRCEKSSTRGKRFLKTTPSATGRVSKTAEILVSGKSDIPTKIAACCSPKPETEFSGLLLGEKHVAIHKLDCKLLSRLDVSRMIDARFSGEPEKERVFQNHQINRSCWYSPRYPFGICTTQCQCK